jgi:hypothetical protein
MGKLLKTFLFLLFEIYDRKLLPLFELSYRFKGFWFWAKNSGNDHEVEFHEIEIAIFHEIEITIMRSKLG